MPHAVRFRPVSVAALSLLVTLSHLLSLSNPLDAAGPLSGQEENAQRLREPHTGLIDGQSLRLAILTIAQPQTQPDRHLNVWIDQRGIIDKEALQEKMEQLPGYDKEGN